MFCNWLMSSSITYYLTYHAGASVGRPLLASTSSFPNRGPILQEQDLGEGDKRDACYNSQQLHIGIRKED